MQSGLGEFPHIGPDPRSHVAGHAGTTGSYKVFGIRPGMNLTVFDVVAGARFGTPPVGTGPCLAIDVLFQAAGEGWLLPPGDPQGISIPYRPGNLYLFFAAQGVRGRYDIPVGTRFRGVDLRVDLAFLDRLGASGLLAGLRAEHPLHAASCAGCWIGVLPLPAGLGPIARSLLDLGLSDGDDLSMEARCLDMVTGAIAILQGRQARRGAPVRDRRKFEAARAMLLSDVAHPWTLAEIARRSGLSEKRLKAGFREAFGSPVYQFLQSARLAEAKRLLAQPDANVTTVSHAIGYSSPSHFAKLFAREFGVQPSAFREKAMPVTGPTG